LKRPLRVRDATRTKSIIINIRMRARAGAKALDRLGGR
jgi:hypothetical protein